MIFETEREANAYARETVDYTKVAYVYRIGIRPKMWVVDIVKKEADERERVRV